jgi:hypothetical protein
MIPYTERDTDLNFRPPYRITGVESLSVVRKINGDEAQKWVDETLNWRPEGVDHGVKFTALPLAFVIFMKMGDMRSIDPPHDDWGGVSESEMVVTLPVVAWGDGLPSIKFYPIVLCLDSSPALISGREAFGFPKIMGQVDIGPDGGEARCEVAPKVGQPKTAKNCRLLALLRTDDSVEADDIGEHRSFSKSLAKTVKDELFGEAEPGFLDDLWKIDWGDVLIDTIFEKAIGMFDDLKSSQEFVFLKQFRDVTIPGAACHRSVATSKMTFSNLTHLSHEEGEWELVVPDFRSSALLHRIGLVSGKVGAPIRAKFQFDLSLGRKIWST